MYHFTHFSNPSSLPLIFFFFVVVVFHIPQRSSSSMGLSSTELINATCTKCAIESNPSNYAFCFTSLQSVPISRATNLRGLAIIAMELALENATNTIPGVVKLLTSGEYDSFAAMCLEDCLELYIDAVATLGNSVAAFLSEKYDIAEVWLNLVMEAAETCEAGFAEKEGEVSPLTKENYNLLQLSNIALCIVNDMLILDFAS